MPKKAKTTKTTHSQSQSLAQAEHARFEGVIWSRPTHSSSKEKAAAKNERGLLNVYKPTATPITPPATLRERAIVARYREFRDKIRKGPLYTVLNSDARVGKSIPYSTLRKTGASGSVLKTDGFGSVPTYTHKYKKSARTMPDLSNMEWFKAYIPEELWPAVDPTMANPETGLAQRKRKARLNIDRLGEGEDGEEVEEEPLDIEIDENWEEDEDEGNREEGEKDDYNAEQYFDGGEDDDIGDDEEGGGGHDYD